VNATLQSPLLDTYPRADVTFVDGDGAWLTADDGVRYLDLVAGIAVVALGHRHPAPLAAAQAQLERLWHTSNLYGTEPMQRLAQLLSERFGGAQAFFCNSGAEAVEAAIKYARKATGRKGIVALDNSFHGRTAGALAATGQPAKRAAFEPLVPGVTFVPANDIGALADAVDADTACVLLEPIQGEGGIHALEKQFVQAAREVADTHGALLVFDEVQTGVGRTGTFFAWERLGIRPDAVTLAKGLANGLPIGALLVADAAAGAFVPGDHGSTFGGNPVACAAACAVCETIDDELLADVQSNGAWLVERLSALPAVTDVRGAGLLLGVELAGREPGDVIDACREKRLLVCAAGERTLRITPPLTITRDELAQALAILEEVLK
jgi:acetylornithine/N-succinyldiaminopimelate aminotransferase